MGKSVAVAACLCICVGNGVGAAQPLARAARTISITENASLHLVRKSGAIINERGTATGTLPGAVSARFDTHSVVKVTGSVTFYPKGGGSLTVNVVGYPQSLSTVTKVSGVMAVRRGSGRFAHAVGSGSFTGTVNRKTWRVTVHAKGKLTY